MTETFAPPPPSNGHASSRRSSPPDYIGAVRRALPAIIICAVIGAFIGIQVPYSQAGPKPLPPGPLAHAFAASAVIGPSPGTTTAPIAPTEIATLLRSPAVDEAAAQGAGLPVSYAQQVGRSLKLSGKSVLGTLEGFLTAEARTRPLTINLANAAAAAIVAQLNANAAAVRANQLAADQKQLAFLQDQIRTLESEARPSSTSSKTTTVTTNQALLQAQISGLTSAYSTEYNSYLNLEGAASPTAGVQVLSAATTATSTRPKVVLSPLRERRVRGSIGLVVGGALALIVVLLMAQLDRRLRSLTAAESAFGLPVVAEIPPQRLRNGPADVVIGRPGSTKAAEAYRTLHWALLSAASRTPPPAAFAPANGGGLGVTDGYDATMPEEVAGPAHPVIAVVSPSGEPTRPVVVANLAAAAAETGRTVIVLDGEAQPRLRRALRDATDAEVAPNLDALVRETTLPGVWRAQLVSDGIGASVPDSALPELVEDARAKFDVVLVDAGGVLTSHYGAAMAHLVDGMAVVGQLGWTTGPQAERAAALLGSLNAPILGMVLTQVPSAVPQRSQARRRPVLGAPPVVPTKTA
jgi:Mrp family chromosome partitioning ATPase